jgi:Na+/H+ antiporter NhaA
MLGLLTPVLPILMREPPLKVVSRVAEELRSSDAVVSKTLHPWVAYGIMPLFALANAGVSLLSIDLFAEEVQLLMPGVVLALVAGKTACGESVCAQLTARRQPFLIRSTSSKIWALVGHSLSLVLRSRITYRTEAKSTPQQNRCSMPSYEGS